MRMNWFIGVRKEFIPSELLDVVGVQAGHIFWRTFSCITEIGHGLIIASHISWRTIVQVPKS